MPEPIMATARELWPTLIEQAGLTGKRNTRKGAYDADLIADVRCQLFPGSSEPLDRLINQSDLSAEQLLRAFFASLRPFALMKIDILRMLADAGADQSGDSLQIRFNLDPETNPLDLLLKEFSRQMERLADAIVDVPTRPLKAEDLWKIPRIGVESIASSPPVQPESIPPGMRHWLDAYDARQPFAFLPSDWRTGRDEVDERLDRVVGLVNSFLAACRRYAPDHDALREYARDDELGDQQDESGLPVRQLWYTESDFWPGAVARWLVERRGDVRGGNEELIRGVITAIDDILPPTDESKRLSERLRLLDEILDLPVWKYRHEVYAVWLGAQIHRSLCNSGWRFSFHVPNGRLEFAFRGVHLATLAHDQYPFALHWWTELGTEHLDLPSGLRTEGIQPDYRIRTASADAKDVLVVEAKQHLRSSAREFSGALMDYAYACRDAVVLLANYGPVGKDMIDEVDAKLRHRCFAFPHVHPGSADDVLDFRSLVSSGLLASLDGRPEKSVPGAVVTLTWGERPKDLDLHIYWEVGDGAHVFYEALDRNVARLVADVRRGHGPEVAFLEANRGEFKIVVRQYSDDGELGDPDSEARVDLVLGYGAHRQKRTFTCSPPRQAAGRGREWEVCRVNTTQLTVTELSLLH